MLAVGATIGEELGPAGVGLYVGNFEGVALGCSVGNGLGFGVGTAVGMELGRLVTGSEHTAMACKFFGTAKHGSPNTESSASTVQDAFPTHKVVMTWYEFGDEQGAN